MALVGARVLGDLAERVGLVAGLSAALAPLKQRRRGHDRGQVVTQLAVAMADGATTLSDLAVLRHQPDLCGAVASTATVWRTLTALTAEPLARIAAARAAARRRVWAAGLDPKVYGIDIDGTSVTAHFDKEGAAPTYQRGYGFYPLVATLDATAEPLAALLRPVNAGSGRAADHITLRDAALAQLPVDPHAQEVIVRTDSAGCSPDFLDWCGAAGVRFIVGQALTEDLAAAVIGRRGLRWIPAATADGRAERDVGEVAEVTPYVDLSRWPPGSRLLVRREIPHPGAQLTFTDVHGYRYRLCLTNLPDPDLASRSPLPGQGAVRAGHPGSQGHGPGPSALRGLRHQPGVADSGVSRRRPPGVGPRLMPARAVAPDDAGPLAVYALASGRPAGAVGSPRRGPSGRRVAVGGGPDGGRRPLSAFGGDLTAAVLP